jgi:hypothetical protein
MSLAQFRVDEGAHNMDGLRLFAHDGSNGSRRSLAAR